MLKATGNHLFIYSVQRDFGFAPNPFHGCCTLATCKPHIRRTAQVGDWVMGMTGSRLKVRERCVYLMEVTEITTFDRYWLDDRFHLKRPLRNGSKVMMVGDNIYHHDKSSGMWVQEDSHHSNSDGTPNMKNLKTDTISDRVLISSHFYYFGEKAPKFDLTSLNYKSVRNFRKLSCDDPNVCNFLHFTESHLGSNLNIICADPFDFRNAIKRVDQSSGRVV